jgi:cytochrome oxidase assembly protein ShyY1
MSDPHEALRAIFQVALLIAVIAAVGLGIWRLIRNRRKREERRKQRRRH